jgi:hypothetical protein
MAKMKKPSLIDKMILSHNNKMNNKELLYGFYHAP